MSQHQQHTLSSFLKPKATTVIVDDDKPKWKDVINEHKTNVLVSYCQKFLSSKKCDHLIRCFDRNYKDDFVRDTYKMVGKEVQSKHKSCAFAAADGIKYSYAGQTKVAKKWPKELADLKEQVEQELVSVGLLAKDAHFNYVLVNLYEDGNSSLGLHVDKEDDMIAGQPIGSVTLGAERDFVLQPIKRRDEGEPGSKRTDTVTMKLHSGSLLVMAKDCQKHYKHAVPVRKGFVGRRYNLTFRVMKNL